MIPTMQHQQANGENCSGAVAIFLARSQSETKGGQIKEGQWDYTRYAEENRKTPFRSWRKVGEAKRATPYVKDSLKFRMARGFGKLSISENERVAWTDHGDESFDRFLESLRGAGGFEKATCSAEGYPKLVMNRGFARPCVTAVDKLYEPAHQQFDETLLRHIKFGNQAEVSSMLQGVSNVHQSTDSTGTTLLHFAAKYGNKDLAQYLINLGAVVDARNRHCETPLVYAVEAGQETIVYLLLKYNADILLPGFRYCALGKVLGDRQNVSENIVTALLNRVTIESLIASAYVKTKQFHDTCQLYCFIPLRNVEITRILLEKGSPVDAKSQVGETALHIAAQQLDLEHVKLLIEFGADVNARKSDGNTPLTCIKKFGDQNRALAIVKVLVAAGATLIDRSSFVKMMEWPLLMHGNQEIIRTALLCPIDLHAANETGLSPLHYLARNKHRDIFEELRGFNFDATIRCSSNATLLHHAASAGNLSSVVFLLDKGIDVDARDELDRAPLIWAVRQGMYHEAIDDHLSCIEVLLDHGANPRLARVGTLAHFSPISYKLALLAEPVVAHLALLEVSDKSIEESVLTEIESCLEYRINYKLTKLQMEETKRVRIFKSVTLLDFFTASNEKISMYARNARLVFNLTNVIKDCNSESYYHRRLRSRFLRLNYLAEMRKNVTVIVAEVLNKIHDLNVHHVAQNIVNHVEDEKLYGMLPTSR